MACSTNEVWLGNLRPATSEQDISEFLMDCGYTSFTVTMGKHHHEMQDSSSCFVEMEDLEDADRLLNNLNGATAPV